MAYNSKHPKVSSILKDLVNLPQPKLEDSGFLERIMSTRNLATFYGVDNYGNRAGYVEACSDAIKNRIQAPFTELWQQRRACFFKPYQSVTEGLLGFIDGIPNVVFNVLAGLGIFGNMYVMIAATCLPAIIELVSAVVSLSQALFYQLKTLSPLSIGDQATASEYLQDGVTRLALVIPLALVSVAATLIGVMRFFTRSTSTLVHLVSHDGEDSDLLDSSSNTSPTI